MRILHVINTMDPKAGGPPMVAAALSSSQARMGLGVSVLSYADPEAIARVEELYRTSDPQRLVKLRFLPPATRMERFFTFNAARVLREILPDFDILHLHGVWDPILRAAGRVARESGKPYLIAPHGMLDPWSLTQSAMLKKIALKVAYRSLLDHSAFIHVLNPDEERGIAPLGLKSPCKVIPNGVFPEEIATLPPKGLFNAKHNPGNRRFVLFLSRVHFKKGLDYLVDAFGIVAEKMDDVDLIIAGPDDGEMEATQTRIAGLKLQNRARCIGPVYGADRFNALMDCDLFCLPSRQEGFSMAITEAMGCGKPVVISDACHFDEVATQGAGKVVGLDAKAVATAMMEVLGNREEATNMGQRGRELVLKKYTWPAIAQRCVEVYGEAMRDKGLKI